MLEETKTRDGSSRRRQRPATAREAKSRQPIRWPERRERRARRPALIMLRKTVLVIRAVDRLSMNPNHTKDRTFATRPRPAARQRRLRATATVSGEWARGAVRLASSTKACSQSPREGRPRRRARVMRKQAWRRKRTKNPQSRGTDVWGGGVACRSAIMTWAAWPCEEGAW